MSTFSTVPPAPDPSLSQLASKLFRCLETALSRQCANRYNAGVSLRCLDEATEDDPSLKIRVECHGLAEMPAHLRLSHTGGNVYDIVCRVIDGDTHRFSYSLPGPHGPRKACMPHLAKELAIFLREELERYLGRVLLQSPEAPTGDETPTRASGN